ncbi:hypothetical protein EST38_g9817 [Candolleomyces aberdarensis]|uniref:Aspartate/glutamate/uridylate kinase domain-containing protein n=1 Tax=Candolleomyces aberdarensis TaxID=2316362 RepID=A0A4Q2D9N8_9AGAR|nr:hypothetical protein EST38_g9817 [Candolleomyces aberdarensis]
MTRPGSSKTGHVCTVVIKLGASSLSTFFPIPIDSYFLNCSNPPSPLTTGTSSIVHEKTHQPLLSTLSGVVETVVKLKSMGHKVVLVSSGAIGVGLRRMNMAARPKGLAGKQALAAIGQGRLIALWDNLFGQVGQPIAQVLLTRGDISDRTRYLNAVSTFKELLSMGVVPIVNENDTVSVSEIKFGDNDTLSAITSSMISADYLFLLTDVDGLYSSNPRKDPNARIIEVVHSVSSIRSEVSTTTLGSSLGTGGMETKLIAAEIATAAGVTTIITNSKRPDDIFGIIEYHNRHTLLPRRLSSSQVVTAVDEFRARSSGGRSTPTSPSPHSGSGAASPEPPLVRPPHTVFSAAAMPLRDLKSWTSHTLYPAGTVIIDAGAYRVLSKRSSGGRLLAAGVLGVIGQFAGGQAVRICVTRKGVSEQQEEAEKKKYESAFSSRPSTPTPVNSPPSASASASGNGSASGSGAQSLSRSRSRSPTRSDDEYDDELSDVETETVTGEYDDEDVIEVGRGLANYNYQQISRVKGMNSSQLRKILGYADSEHVVENITIRVAPVLPTESTTAPLA